jgi:hypothetical protein
MYRILRTPLFVEQFNQFNPSAKKRIIRFIQQLTINGSKAGKPLGFVFFREKKFDGKRMYFLVYEEWKTILIVAFSNKKIQQETIDRIRKELPRHKERVFETIENEKIT